MLQSASGKQSDVAAARFNIVVAVLLQAFLRPRLKAWIEGAGNMRCTKSIMSECDRAAPNYERRYLQSLPRRSMNLIYDMKGAFVIHRSIFTQDTI